MTKSRALQILIDHACQNCAGSGVGVRSIPSASTQKAVKEAIRTVWKGAYSCPLDENFFLNRGLYRGD